MKKIIIQFVVVLCLIATAYSVALIPSSPGIEGLGVRNITNMSYTKSNYFCDNSGNCATLTELNSTYDSNSTYDDTSITAKINAVNTSSNIKGLGFNLTTELKTYFDTLYMAVSYITTIQNWISGNYTASINYANGINTSTNIASLFSNDFHNIGGVDADTIYNDSDVRQSILDNSTADRSYTDASISSNRSDLISLFSANDTSLSNRITAVNASANIAGLFSNDFHNIGGTDLDTNCTVGNSCPLITYDSELAYINNCSVDQSCANVIYTTDKLGNTTTEIRDAINQTGLSYVFNVTANHVSGWPAACSETNSFRIQELGSSATCDYIDFSVINDTDMRLNNLNMTDGLITDVSSINFTNGGAIWDNGTHICIGSC